MSEEKRIKRAVVSVYHKEGLEQILKSLDKHGVELISTGGTEKYIRSMGLNCTAVEDFTSYPSILGGRVKTLHPSIMGGILARRGVEADERQCEMYEIPKIDLVIVDLYPFADTLASGASHEEIIEKIDIGGVSLIRAAAKNYKDVVICPSQASYAQLESDLKVDAVFSLEQRLAYATKAFAVTNTYDAAIYEYMIGLVDEPKAADAVSKLRYGENPHQKGSFVGDVSKVFTQIHGKELSYNNFLDIDAAIALMKDFDQVCTFAILKHNNPCGLAQADSVKEAYLRALSGDPLSAFGGILICNKEIDAEAALEINKLFCEVLIAPTFADKALELLKSKKNRILLEWNMAADLNDKLRRSCLNGYLLQDRDCSCEQVRDCKCVTTISPSKEQFEDLIFANIVVKHCKSNAIVLVKDKCLLAAGVGQTSRIDALKHAINHAKAFEHTLDGAVLASDAFFPFRDCVDTAVQAGIKAIIQPGGSVRDEESIAACDENSIAMCFTGKRHFKH